MAFAKEDPIEDLIEFQEAVENLPVNEFLYSKLPTSLLPKTVKNAEVINAILIKSWKIQGSHWPALALNCLVVHAYLMYYFKSINIADKMEQTSFDYFGANDHSFLKIGDHIIDNTYF